MTNAMRQEFSARIVVANGSAMIELLYEIMLVYLEDAIGYHESGLRRDFSVHIKKSRACLEELKQSIQQEHELAERISSIYRYCNEQLTMADIHNDIAPLKEVEGLITRFREAYEVVAKKDQSAPVMDNAQSIYAGLTYGKNMLNENLSSQGDNRGFLI